MRVSWTWLSGLRLKFRNIDHDLNTFLEFLEFFLNPFFTQLPEHALEYFVLNFSQWANPLNSKLSNFIDVKPADISVDRQYGVWLCSCDLII